MGNRFGDPSGECNENKNQIMNVTRRARISAVIQKLGDCKSEIEEIKDEEQEAYDSMPESLQTGERGEASQTALEALQLAEDDTEGAITQLEGIE